MTEKQFVVWLKGFTEACHHLNTTPAQWDKIVETLKTVKSEGCDCGCDCKTKTYSYPYQGFTGTGEYITNDASKQILND
jgi:ribose 5-phosphate isomerase RpiB